MLIIPDTNFLVYITKYRLWHELDRLYGKYNLVIMPEVVYELENLIKKSKGKDKKDTLIALELIKQIKNNKTKSKKGYVDKLILIIAKSFKKINKENFVIATMDKALIKKINKENIKVLTIRQKKHLIER